MTRKEVIKIINDDPHLTIEQGKAIIERFMDCNSQIKEEINVLVSKYNDIDTIHNELYKVCFMIGYVYASIELNGKVDL